MFGEPTFGEYMVIEPELEEIINIDESAFKNDILEPSVESKEQSTIIYPNVIEHAITAQKKRKIVLENNETIPIEEYKPSNFEVKVNLIDKEKAALNKVQRVSEHNSVKRQKRYYKDDPLELICEWKNCQKTTFSSPEEFTRHVKQHCSEADVVHNKSPPQQSVFLCLWADCGFETAASPEMVRHINFHGFHTKIKGHGAAMVTALGLPSCSLAATQRNILPDLSSSWICEWPGCNGSEGEDWTVPQHFYWHVSQHAESLRGQSLMHCQWPGCTRVDNAVSKVKEHLRCHSQEKLVACPTCGGLFASRAKFLDHVKRQETGGGVEGQFPCDTCGKTFVLARLLKDHMRSHVNQYQCPACEMTCPTPSTLATHIRYRHTTERPHQCQYCQYRGKTMADIRSHVRVHYNEAELQCDSCKFSCRAAATLARHKANKHEDSVISTSPKYQCHLCDKLVAQGNLLSRHLMTEHSFRLPSGYSRFRYKLEERTGLYRLNTHRLEAETLQEVETANLPIV